jgi:NAD(P)H dehydrogenase (quinone)
MIVVTGAAGQLGQQVVQQLLEKVAAAEVAAVVRNPGKVADLAARGVQVRVADYDDPAALDAALAGADRV